MSASSPAYVDSIVGIHLHSSLPQIKLPAQYEDSELRINRIYLSNGVNPRCCHQPHHNTLVSDTANPSKAPAIVGSTSLYWGDRYSN